MGSGRTDSVPTRLHHRPGPRTSSRSDGLGSPELLAADEARDRLPDTPLPRLWSLRLLDPIDIRLPVRWGESVERRLRLRRLRECDLQVPWDRRVAGPHVERYGKLHGVSCGPTRGRLHRLVEVHLMALVPVGERGDSELLAANRHDDRRAALRAKGLCDILRKVEEHPGALRAHSG